MTQALLGVRYEIAESQQDDVLMTQAAAADGYYLYENRYALPLGFMVSDLVEETQVVPSSPFLLQNDWIMNACGVPDVFHIMSSYGGAKAEFTLEEEGRCLIYIPTSMETCSVTMFRNDEQISRKQFDSLEPPQIIDIGDVKAQDRIVVTSEDELVTSLTVYPAVMDYVRYEEAMQKLEQNGMTILSYTDTEVVATVEAQERELLFTTIPYDEGWSVDIDGQKADYRDFKNSFIILDLEPGEHTVVFRYWPTGLTAGIIVSAAAILAFILWMVIRRMLQQRHSLSGRNAIAEEG